MSSVLKKADKLNLSLFGVETEMFPGELCQYMAANVLDP